MSWWAEEAALYGWCLCSMFFVACPEMGVGLDQDACKLRQSQDTATTGSLVMTSTYVSFVNIKT